MAFREGSGSSSSGGFTGWVIHAVLRFLQFVFAIAVAGLYGTDISNARKHGEAGDSRWVSGPSPSPSTAAELGRLGY